MPGEQRKATHELSEFDVQEVSLVDRAANKMRFAITKRDGAMPGKKMAKSDWVAHVKTTKAALDAVMLKLRKADGVTKLDLSLPAEAKEGLMTALAEGLDKLSAIATMVGDAKVDDAAQPPADLGAALMQVGEMLAGAAEQFASGAGAAPEGDKPADGAGSTPPPPPEGAGAPAADGGAEKAAKALPPELGDGDSLKTELHDGDALKSELHKCAATAHATIAKITKAGRKMSGARFEKLKAVSDLVAGLVNELAYDEASGAATDKGATNKSDETAALERRLADTIAQAATDKTALEKRLAEVEKRAALPNSGVPGEGGPRTPVKKRSTTEDLGEGVEERRASRQANKRK